MTTAVDSNAIAALWDPDPELSRAAQAGLEAARQQGTLAICACVFAELLAGPGRSQAFLDEFLEDTGIIVDWELEPAIWRAAGRAFQAYAARRHARQGAPRRILADFLIGAHALQRGYRLLTLDDRLYRRAFPRLTVISF